MKLDIVNILTACWLCYLSMFALSMSMERSSKLVFNKVLPPRLSQISYWLGWGLLLLALYACVAVWGWAIGITAGFGIATLIIGLSIFIQSYRPRLNFQLSIVFLCLVLGLQFFRMI